MTDHQMMCEIATHLDRLYPTQVDRTPISWGDGQQAGHKGYAAAEGGWPSVGWYSDGGNVGHRLFTIHFDDVPTLLQRLAELPDGYGDTWAEHDRFAHPLRDLPVFAGLRVEWSV